MVRVCIRLKKTLDRPDLLLFHTCCGKLLRSSEIKLVFLIRIGLITVIIITPALHLRRSPSNVIIIAKRRLEQKVL